MTELGDAELTEQGIIALSGHRTAEAARGYIKRTEVQKHAALMKRRDGFLLSKRNRTWTRVGIDPLPRSRNADEKLS